MKYRFKTNHSLTCEAADVGGSDWVDYRVATQPHRQPLEWFLDHWELVPNPGSQKIEDELEEVAAKVAEDRPVNWTKHEKLLRRAAKEIRRLRNLAGEPMPIAVLAEKTVGPHSLDEELDRMALQCPGNIINWGWHDQVLRTAANEIRSLRSLWKKANEEILRLKDELAEAGRLADRDLQARRDAEVKIEKLQEQLKLWENFTQTDIRYLGLPVWVVGSEETAKRFSAHVGRVLRDREQVLFGEGKPVPMLYGEGDLKIGRKIRIRYENGREETVEITGEA